MASGLPHGKRSSAIRKPDQRSSGRCARMKHIAFLLPTLNRIGGAERQVVLLATGLAARGWRVTVVALSGTCGEACGELHTAGVEFLSLHMRKGLADPQGWIRLNAWLKQARPAILH